jgi:hypothetical protein
MFYKHEFLHHRKFPDINKSRTTDSKNRFSPDLQKSDISLPFGQRLIKISQRRIYKKEFKKQPVVEHIISLLLSAEQIIKL